MIVPNGKKILLVDDCRMIRKIVATILHNAGYEVTEAEDGNVAFKKMASDPFHLIITDLNMPNLDGIGLLRLIRSEPTCSSVPVVMLTSEAFDKQRWGCGATGWVQKPFSPGHLLSVVRKSLGESPQG